jgi:putative addiction module CopG family antidote
MNVHIPEHWQRFIQDAIKSGRFASADQMIDEALRLLKEHDQAPAESPKADTGEATSTHKPIWEVAADLRTSIPEEEWAKLPVDGAEQHDHYIYGTQKRPATR